MIAGIGAAIAVLLQIVLAPYLAINGAMPNFVVVYAVLLAIMRGTSYSCVLPFVLGLLYDLFSGGPVGAMAFTLMVLTIIASRIFAAVDNDTFFMPVVLAAGNVLLVEVVYGVFLLMFGYNAGFVDAFVYRALPCAIYDIVISLALLPLFKRLFVTVGPVSSDITQLR